MNKKLKIKKLEKLVPILRALIILKKEEYKKYKKALREQSRLILRKYNIDVDNCEDNEVLDELDKKLERDTEFLELVETARKDYKGYFELLSKEIAILKEIPEFADIEDWKIKTNIEKIDAIILKKNN